MTQQYKPVMDFRGAAAMIEDPNGGWISIADHQPIADKLAALTKKDEAVTAAMEQLNEAEKA